MSKRRVVVFDKATGKISKVTVANVSATDEIGGTSLDAGIRAGFAFADCDAGVLPNLHYVSAYVDGAGINGSDGTATVIPRPDLDVSGLSLSGAAPHALALTRLASGSVIYAINEEGQVAEFDGSEDLTLSDAGTYTLRILPTFPAVPVVLTVEVT